MQWFLWRVIESEKVGTVEPPLQVILKIRGFLNAINIEFAGYLAKENVGATCGRPLVGKLQTFAGERSSPLRVFSEICHQ